MSAIQRRSDNDMPNIILLYADQMRADAIAAAGNPAIHTPNLDRLAAEGVLFSHCCSTTPVCVAARYSLLTGRREGQTGRWANNRPQIEPLHDTLPALLGSAGYYTHSIGKMHFSPTRRHYGFHRREVMQELPTWPQDDDYLTWLIAQGYGHKREIHGVRNLLYVQPQTSPLPQEVHGTWWCGDRMEHFLRTNADRRFFLWTGFVGPHPPYNVPAPWESMYALEDMPFPIQVDRDEETLPLQMRMLRYYANYENASEDRLRRCVALYYAACSLIDHQVGRILNTLEELDILDETLIMFTGDHGELLGDFNACQKMSPYESSVRVPLLMRWPERIEAGRVCDDLVGCTDFLPTFLDAAGMDHPVLEELSGQSLLGADGGGHAQPRDEWVTCYGTGASRWLSLRRPGLKDNYYCDNGWEELYDLDADPTEAHNLLLEGAEGARATADEMRGRLVAWEISNGFPESTVQDGELRNFGVEKPALRRNNQFPNWVNYIPDDWRRNLEAPGLGIEEALAREDTLDIEELDLKFFKENGGSLAGSRWEGLLERY
ncbi:MAG: sulfatase-like hydrolase/transferase [candidate division WS1 bacterium]|nr:sulfatase-like hydrolase/transferase [candidate division WS1 bacterium]